MKSLSVLLIFSLSLNYFAQDTLDSKSKMSELSFMIGNWLGTSKSFENGKLVSEVPAYQAIAYNLDKHIIEINLKSETLQLHTIIWFDENENTYYYQPFSKKGSRKLKAKAEDNTFTVHANPTTRFIFTKTEKGFMEYGEKLENGKWTIYFKDEFTQID